ncbi:unnamed protein product [Haemonchus placei]|uniref:Sushi domain protein n=1 Tax=Haemonchus placei TaxID=6290 RepID=A0A0N4W1Z2_HAEPC|nr:unnamed protein product [Haemonchus placei]
MIQRLLAITALSSIVYALDCPTPLPPLGGTTSFTGTAREGSVAIGTCPLGQIMSGASSLTCTNGAWNPPAFGICTTTAGIGGLTMPMTSGLGTGMSPILPSTGLGVSPILPSTGLGLGTGRASTAICQNGQWQPSTMGTCSNSNYLGLPTSYGDGYTNIASGLSGLSTDLPCPFGVIPPLNGNVVYSARPPYPRGTTVTLTCDPGYVVSGQSTATCNNGLFGIIGTCIKA